MINLVDFIKPKNIEAKLSLMYRSVRPSLNTKAQNKRKHMSLRIEYKKLSNIIKLLLQHLII